jgi:hypothetical protein
VPFQLVRANPFDGFFLSSGLKVGPSFDLNSWYGTRAHLLTSTTAAGTALHGAAPMTPKN